jgi:signal transduction histidine kinase
LNLIQDTIHDLRQGLVELDPAPTSERLSDLLRLLSEEPRLRSLFTIKCSLDFQEGEPGDRVRLHHILAIANEALSNVARHARASKVLLNGATQDGQFVLTIEDNGAGLAEDARLGFGLRNMRDRARMLNGKLEVLNAVPHGTIVRLTLPLKEENG